MASTTRAAKQQNRRPRQTITTTGAIYRVAVAELRRIADGTGESTETPAGRGIMGRTQPGACGAACTGARLGGRITSWRGDRAGACDWRNGRRPGSEPGRINKRIGK